MIANALVQWGHTVEVAYDPADALARVAVRAPEVALLDIGLPVMDGYELGRRLRELPGGTAIRLVAVTGYAQESDRTRSGQAGFDAHLAKPIDLRELMRIIGP